MVNCEKYILIEITFLKITKYMLGIRMNIPVHIHSDPIVLIKINLSISNFKISTANQFANKGNNKIAKLRTIFQRDCPNS